MARRHLLLVAVLVLARCAGTAGRHARTSTPDSPKNIIIMFADGPAAIQFELARSAARHLRNEPFTITGVILQEGALGLLTTSPWEAIATDSAATATAMSTGVKAAIGAIGLAPDGQSVRTLFQAANARGKRIGLVTTASVHDATPAAFSVHAKSRAEFQGILDQYLALAPDVLLGGGLGFGSGTEGQSCSA